MSITSHSGRSKRRVTNDAPGAALSIEGLSVSYAGAGNVVDDVSLEVEAGSIVALVGPNGAGKSTVLRAVSGLLRHHSGAIRRGSVRLDGVDITGGDPAQVVRRGVAQVLEGRQVFPNLSVSDNLAAGSYSRWGDAETAATRAEVLELFPVLGRRLDQHAGFLSGGEQQMLAIGRALMARPRLLVLDEPSLGLAPRIVEEIREVILAINARGTSILLVEQNALLAFRIADHGHVLEGGRIAVSGRAAELAVDERVAHYYLGERSVSGRRTRRRQEGAATA
ncbi:ABC transporter ATP-binding protein [Nocardioides sp. GXZ039]|uniref:ABC transporter ATP-binding protein n=1 Tax=Nocardioides sp. GXZ039 TaxID=3136018 RepID=UPI0030F3D025